MKVGDQLVVSMEGFNVAHAIIESIEGDEVSIRIPETRVIMGVKHSLTDFTPEPSGTEQMIIGTEEKDYEDSADRQPAPVSSVPAPGLKAEDVSNEGLRGVTLDSSAID